MTAQELVTQVYTDRILKKADALILKDIEPLHRNFKIFLHSITGRTHCGCVSEFQIFQKLIVDGPRAVKFDDLTDDIKTYYINLAIEELQKDSDERKENTNENRKTDSRKH